jgi:radical SAM superfamily enzyme YgiQ (UPF0313 family)
MDTSRGPLGEAQVAAATLVGFYLPMHTATRLAAPLIDQVRRINPAARLCAYGLYAPLNADWLRQRGVDAVFGPEAEEELVRFANSQPPTSNAHGVARLQFIQPDRSTLPSLEQYASLRLPDGSRRLVGSTDATRGCKHLCRHCPIVPVYQGHFRVVAAAVVLADIGAQVARGAQHITFGDPDFFNGPTHARRIVSALAAQWPGLTYDVTIKIEHLLAHADLLPLLKTTGCLFVTSAVESIDDAVLAHLRKGHTRADFVTAAALCREAGLTLMPTFVPFHPWTTPTHYVELLDLIEDLGLIEHVAPIQLAIRLLITAQSPLLELDDVRAAVTEYDAQSLTWPWRHRDPVVDRLQQEVMRVVGEMTEAPRTQAFRALVRVARAAAGMPPRATPFQPPVAVPAISEPWYCCAEPMENF